MSMADVALSPIRKESVHSAAGFFESQLRHYSSESIMLFLRVSGSVIPLRVLESDSIASVKLRIQTCKGFVVRKQTLVFEGRELARNDTLIKDYGITGENVLHLVLRLSDLLHITVSTIGGKEFDFHVDRHRNVGYLKQRILKKGRAYDPEDDDQELFCNGEELDDQRLIDDICKNTDDVIHLVVQKSAKVRAKRLEKDLELSVEAPPNSNERKEEVSGVANHRSQGVPVVTWRSLFRNPDFFLEPIVINPKVNIPTYVWEMLNSTFKGMEKGNVPVRSSEGTGGTYFMQDSSQEFISVFKPMDEEPNAVNNPHGLPMSPNGEGLKRGTRVGEGALREVAAYLLDHPKCGPRNLSSETIGFAGVPPTILVKCLHKGFNHPKGYDSSFSKNVKIGSLQMFMKNEGSCEDMGPSLFPVEEVHKISVFDLRMANADRHSGNILFGKGEDGKTLLIPIDHGYCLPENFEDCTFDWLYWPQACQPYSAETIEYINSLDAEEDIAILKFYGWDIPIESARTLRISTMLLKKGVERGLTPFAIGSLMCRENINKESVIEEIVREAQHSLLPGTSEAAFLQVISEVMDSQLDKLAK